MSLLNRSASRLPLHSRLFASRVAQVSPLASSRLVQSRRSEGTLAYIGDTISQSLGSCVITASETMSSLHAAGMPWYLVFPAVAVVLNFTIRLPARLGTRAINQRREDLKPLKRAWISKREAENMRKNPGDKSSTLARFGRSVSKANELNRTFGAGSLKSWSYIAVSFFPFVLVTESIRRLSGSQMTWLGEKLSLDSLLNTVEGVQSSALALFDPTLANGGCLWFVDLTAADPYWGLPLLCSAMLYVQTARQMTRERLRTLFSIEKADNPEMVKLSNAFGRAMLLLPLFPLVLAGLPSAVFLYMLPTFALNNINLLLLPKVRPASLKKPEAPPATGRRTGMVARGSYKVPTPKSQRAMGNTRG